MKVAVVGATGLVGNVILKLLAERNFPVDELLLVASPKSVGKLIPFMGKDVPVIGIDDAISQSPDFAIFSAGGSTSKQYAEAFAAAGSIVIDNSSAWRSDPTKPLVVAGVNDDHILGEHKIIANPNCSTMQLMVALAPLHQKYKIKRLVISTYQSFTGTGKQAVDQYESEKSTDTYDKETAAYPHKIFANCIPHCGDFDEDGYTTEERKLENETKKILNDSSIKITATAVRVPVFGGHSEAVNIEFEHDYDLSEVKSILEATEGLIVQDSPSTNEYPMPLNAYETDPVYVGRLRRDTSVQSGLNLWVVADNLRKGAATNTIEIAENLIKSGRV